MKNKEAVKAFGLRLRRLRDERKLTQQEFADLCDLSKSSVQRFEYAQMNATIDVLVTISKVFNLSLSELMDFPIPKEAKKKK